MQKLNRFILEKSYNDIETNMIKEKLDKNSYMYDYILMNTSDISSVVKEDVKNIMQCVLLNLFSICSYRRTNMGLPSTNYWNDSII